ncbi:unnamed protein product [Mytilus edulis]|uniref:GH29D-like beta-sandwich domain-containing protein n=1 Tax=Mytilus edulis TaxID=6550 RepID=A0A8S3UT81_MYTED|nr:unnamed protein product [Mytilus edulis]
MSGDRINEGQEEPVVSVSANGFAVPEITIMEGQVIHDGDKLRPVIGGFSCDINKCKGRYNQQFNLEGEYKFAIEYKVELLDRSFQPMILLIEEGDRPVQNGFRSSVPSKQGLLSHEFYTPGVYYYSDQNFQEAAEYIGTIIVKPKQKEHYVDLTEKGFTQEKYHHLNEDAIRLCTSVGLATTQYTTIGVYNYRIVNGPDSMNTCSVIVNPGPKLMDDIRVSSVICDERYDNQEPLNVISGPKAFNSGKPTPDNSFLYTFDEPGSYTVASQGAPGYSCIVFVLAAAGRVSDPFISSVDGGSVNSGTKITLGCDSPGSKIYFTIDGAPPELHLDSAKMMKSPLVSNDGGPIISLERTEKEDAISVVWMSIDSRSYPISGYLVFLNDQQCEVDDSKVSNLLEVTLPLYVSEIVLPPEGKRLEEEELYLEYIEIHEGSGYLQAMDDLYKESTFLYFTLKNGEKNVRPLRRKGDTSLNESLDLYYKQQSIYTGSVSSDTISKSPGMEPEQLLAKPLKSRDSKQDLHQVNRADYISRAMTVGKGVNKFEKAVKNQRMNSLASQEYPGMEPEQSLAKPLKSRDSKQDLYQVNRADYISRAMTVGRGVNNFEKAIKNQRVNSLASQEYPYQPEPPHSERTEISRRQSYASNMVSRKSSLHPNDAFHEPYGMERALSPAQMPPSGFTDPMSKRPSIPVINEPRKKPLSLRMLGKLGTLKSLDIKMEEHKPFSGITFKMVATAMTNFLTQQNFILSGLAPKIYKHKPKMKFDWAKFRHFVLSTKAFENPVNSATRVFQMKAPPVVAGKQIVNQYMRHFQEMADDNDNSEYEENNVRHPPNGPRGQFRRHRRMSRSQEDIPHPENRNLSPYQNQRYRHDSHVLSHQPRSFDGPSPDRIKRYPIMSGARNIERTRARTSGYDTNTMRHRQDYSPSRHERDLSRPRSFTQQDFDQFLYEQGIHNNYEEYEDPDLYYHGNYGRPGRGRDDQPGRDDGYWDEDDESSEDFEPLPPRQQELPHGERYKMLPQENNTRRHRERHSPGRHGNIVYDSSPDEIERRTDRSRRSSHYMYSDRSPEAGQRKSYRNHEGYYNASPEDDRKGYFGKHSSPETSRRHSH